MEELISLSNFVMTHFYKRLVWH